MPRRAHLLIRCALALLLPASVLAFAVPARAASTGRVVGARRHDAGPAGVRAPEAAIANADTGAILWSRDLNTERPMASITKVMTALVVLRAGNLNREIKVPSAVIAYIDKYDASNAGLHPGDWLTARELLYAMLLPSGADAAYALAEAYGPGLSSFVSKMNATARQLGMSHTHFSNFDGLPYPSSYSDYSTAADLIKLGRAAMDWSVFRSVVSTRTYRLSAGSGHHAYTWDNLNPLLGHYPGAKGIKTGWTPAAGPCLLFESTLGGVSLIGVELDGTGNDNTGTVTAGDAIAMLNWGFGQAGA
jgi:serine-type D-Ala-D-Ala carboxypeptidase (penicillin-binding protein 5/6)